MANTKGAGGRPTVMTPETLKKLEEGFILGLTDEMACLFANISPRTLYAYCSDNEEFSQRKEQLKRTPLLNARATIAKAMQGHDKPDLALKVLERRDPDFKPKAASEVKHSGSVAHFISAEMGDVVDNLLGEVDADVQTVPHAGPEDS